MVLTGTKREGGQQRYRRAPALGKPDLIGDADEKYPFILLFSMQQSLSHQTLTRVESSPKLNSGLLSFPGII